MARRPATKPRKHAAQARSRATVDALVDATARILVREGFDKASTNRIAQVAGVSVGSLYQYFPGKEALVVAVAQRHSAELMRVVHGELARVAALPLDQGIAALVAAAVTAHRVDPELHRVLAEEIPRVGALQEVGTFNRDNYALFAGYLAHHRNEIGVDDLGLAAFVGMTTIEALTHSAVLHHPEVLADDAMDAFIGEATRLVTGYLSSR
jgi:AcrR family transcriptional regulator